MASEEDLAGASYVMSFLDDVENLTNTYATYLNVMVRMQDKYDLGKKDKEEKRKKTLQFDADDERAILEVNEAIRVWIARCFVKANTLQQKIPEMKTGVKALRKSYNASISSSTIDKDIAEDFVMEINKIFMEGILKDLLLKSRDVYREVLQ